MAVTHKWHVEGTSGLYVSLTDGWDTADDWNDPTKGGAEGVTDADLGSEDYPWRTVSAMILSFETEEYAAHSIAIIHGSSIEENMPIRSKILNFKANTGNTVIKHSSNYQFSRHGATQHLNTSESLTGFSIIADSVFNFGFASHFYDGRLSGQFNLNQFKLINVVLDAVSSNALYGMSGTSNVTIINSTIASVKVVTDLLVVGSDVGDISNIANCYIYNSTYTTVEDVQVLEDDPDLDANGFLPITSALQIGEAGHIGAKPAAISIEASALNLDVTLKNLIYVNGALEVVQMNVAPQAATVDTITLNAIAEGDLTGLEIEILSGTGAGQTRTIQSYDSATKIAAVAAWDTIPDATSLYALSAHFEKTVDFKVLATLNEIVVDCPYVQYITLSVGSQADELTDYKVRNGAQVTKAGELGNADIDYTDIALLSGIDNVRFCKIAFTVQTPHLSS